MWQFFIVILYILLSLDIQDQITNLQFQFNKFIVHGGSYTKSYSTLTEYHQNNCKNGYSMFNPNLHSEWKQHEMKRCFDTSYQSGSEETVQKFWKDFVAKIDCHSDVTFMDCHSKEALPNRKPDIIIKKEDGNDVSTFNIVAIGELKKQGSINDANKGQLEDYLFLLLKSQPFRKFSFGFVTNNCQILMAKAVKVEQKIPNAAVGVVFQWFIDENLGGDAGKRALSWLSSLSLEDHGYCLPVIPSLAKLESYVGSGTFSDVYSGYYQGNGEKCVAKVFKNKEDATKEYANLMVLQDIPTTPTVLHYNKDKILIMKPFAQSLDVCGLHKAVDDIVHTLFEAHNKGLVHRDIKDANLFIAEDKTILVNDWGSAVEISATLNKFSGTVVGGSDNILDSLLNKHVPPPKINDDLHALARTIFRKIYQVPPNLLPTDGDLNCIPAGSNSEKMTEEYIAKIKKFFGRL